MIDGVLAAKLADFQKLPLVGSFIKPELLDGLKRSLLSEVDRQQPAIKERLAREIVERIDIAALAREELAALDLDGLENAVMRVAKRELRAIEYWGALLGGLIGLAQALGLRLLAGLGGGS
jgi:uncharacterized membrane protein YheB (UPF0754 family)